MPKYDFRNKETGEETEVWLKISELDEFKANNPHLKQFLKGAPGIGDSIRLGLRKPDQGFREVLSKAKENHPKGNVNTF
jgi:hypothetical protein